MSGSSRTLDGLELAPAADQPSTSHDVALLAGRLAFVAIYLVSGFGKIEDLGGLEAMLAAGGVPFPALAATGGTALEVGAAAAIAIGWRTRPAATGLLLFTILVTLLMHPFWLFGGPVGEAQFVQFMKNLGLAGGCLMLAGAGAGRLSVDGWRARRRPSDDTAADATGA